jgi:glutamate synthase (ferredoxin)
LSGSANAFPHFALMSRIIPSPLYNSEQEHDACGVGFIAKVSGERSHDVVERAIAALKSLAHRGAIDADAVTGDGAGTPDPDPARAASGSS